VHLTSLRFVVNQTNRSEAEDVLYRSAGSLFTQDFADILQVRFLLFDPPSRRSVV
jgi:hypothetical protein